jgi:MOSC domain-containing protein YiiM
MLLEACHTRRVRPSGLPASQAPRLSRSVAACLATILELSVEEVPCPAEGPPWPVWRNWLAERGLGLVPISQPSAFNWPGPWLAVLREETAAVAFGSPPGLVWAPLLEDETFESISAGYLVAPMDPALWVPTEQNDLARSHGHVEAIAVARAAEAPMTLLDEAVAHAGRGLEGDRYFNGAGTFSNPASSGHDLTLIEAERLETITLASEHTPTAEDARRNLVTRGIDLNALVGRRFRVGEVECVGRRLCEPCAHLERLTEVGLLRELVHRGGLRADIVSDGRIAVGDEIEALEA